MASPFSQNSRSQDLSAQQLKMVRHFKAPVPVREVSLVTHRNFVKKRLLDALRQEILLAVPQAMQHKDRRAVVEL